MKIIYLMITSIMIFAISCFKMSEMDDLLSLPKGEFVGDELRIDGYYYCEKESFDGIYYNRYLFYNNGVIRYGGASDDINDNVEWGTTSKINWGVFIITGQYC